MKVEIWSDVACPWCYIGKRRFEEAMAQYPNAKNIEIEWKSFQLAPGLQTNTTTNIFEYLSKRMSISIDRAKQMNEQVTSIAGGVGLNYHMDKVVVANTFNAHRFIHFAKEHGKQDAAKERLMKAYFTEGKNIDDRATLAALAQEIGLDGDTLLASLGTSAFSDDVKHDIDEANQIGVSGVPFFVFDRKYAVSGAQESSVFLKTLEKSFAEWQKNNPDKLEIIDGKACKPNADCE